MRTLNNYLTEAGVVRRDTRLQNSKVKAKSWVHLIELTIKAIEENGSECDLNFIDVSNVDNMNSVFRFPETRMFNGDISGWDVSNVTNMQAMFEFSDFNGNISHWDVSNVENMERMFQNSKFKEDISKWTIKDNCNTYEMFKRCHIPNNHKPKNIL